MLRNLEQMRSHKTLRLSKLLREEEKRVSKSWARLEGRRREIIGGTLGPWRIAETLQAL
jgi:hypothetical protein